jgi:hypothetical protein
MVRSWQRASVTTMPASLLPVCYTCRRESWSFFHSGTLFFVHCFICQMVLHGFLIFFRSVTYCYLMRLAFRIMCRSFRLACTPACMRMHVCACMRTRMCLHARGTMGSFTTVMDVHRNVQKGCPLADTNLTKRDVYASLITRVIRFKEGVTPRDSKRDGDSRYSTQLLLTQAIPSLQYKIQNTK